MTTPESIEPQYTLLTAVSRLDELRMREAMGGATDTPDRAELLELLALSEVVARKASYGRQLTVRAARVAGASWSQIGAALGTSKQAAWEAHTRWIDAQREAYGKPGQMGFDEADVAEARAVAGGPAGRRRGARGSRRTADEGRRAPGGGTRNEGPPIGPERNDLASTCKVAALRPRRPGS